MQFQGCPSCNHPNPLGTNYCNQCGDSLHVKTCPRCNSISDALAMVCAVCRAPFPERPIIDTDIRWAMLQADVDPITLTDAIDSRPMPVDPLGPAATLDPEVQPPREPPRAGATAPVIDLSPPLSQPFSPPPLPESSLASGATALIPLSRRKPGAGRIAALLVASLLAVVAIVVMMSMNEDAAEAPTASQASPARPASATAATGAVTAVPGPVPAASPALAPDSPATAVSGPAAARSAAAGGGTPPEGTQAVSAGQTPSGNSAASPSSAADAGAGGGPVTACPDEVRTLGLCRVYQR